MSIPDQYKGLGYGTIYGDSEIRQAIANAEVAKLIGGNGGGSVDPTKPNAVELSDGTNFYNALSEGTPASGITGPTGGSGALKWLSGIWSLISDRIPVLTLASGDALKIAGTVGISGTPTVTISNSSIEIANDIGNPVPVTILDGLTVSASLSALGVLFVRDTIGYQSVSVQTNGAGSSTVVFEDSDDGTIWNLMVGYDLSSNGYFNPSISSGTAQRKVFPLFAKFFRVRVSAFTSGTASCTATFRTFPFLGAMNVQQSTNTSLQTIAASSSGHNSVANNNSAPLAHETRITQRAATADNTTCRPIADKLGRTILKRGQVRELQQNDSLVVSTTAETTLIAAVSGASIYNDITDLVISNTSITTSTRVDIRDSPAGTIRFSVWVAAATTQVFSFAGILKQSIASAAWTAQLSAATTDVRITALSEKTA